MESANADYLADMATRFSDMKARYPYQFVTAPSPFQYDVPAGWVLVFEQLCTDVDALLQGKPHAFHWARLKDKLGGPRWIPCFTHGLEAHDAERLQELRFRAEKQASELCVVCGSTPVHRNHPSDAPVCASHADSMAG